MSFKKISREIIVLSSNQNEINLHASNKFKKEQERERER